MPRQARATSSTCVYHAILCGVSKQQLFEEEEVYETYPDDSEYEKYLEC